MAMIYDDWGPPIVYCIGCDARVEVVPNTGIWKPPLEAAGWRKLTGLLGRPRYHMDVACGFCPACVADGADRG